MSRAYALSRSVLQAGVLIALVYAIAMMAVDWMRGTIDMIGVDARATTVTRFTAVDLKALDGTVETLSPQSGQLLLVEVWATWCPTCRIEMSRFQKLAERIDPGCGRAVAVSIDKQVAFAREWMIANGYPQPGLSDPGGRLMRDRFAVTSVPKTLLIDGRGFIVERFDGVGRLSSNQWIDRLYRVPGLGVDCTRRVSLSGEIEYPSKPSLQ